MDQLTGIESAIFSDRIHALPATASDSTKGAPAGNGEAVGPVAERPVGQQRRGAVAGRRTRNDVLGAGS
jgi:hypothetical protein